MKGLEVEMEQLKQLVVALMGRWLVPVVPVNDDKVGEGGERDARECSPQPGRRLRVGNGDRMEGDGAEGNVREDDGSKGDRRQKEMDNMVPTQELLRGSDRWGKEDSKGVCG